MEPQDKTTKITSELVLPLPQEITDGRQYHDGFPAHVWNRARTLILRSTSYAHAWRQVKAELEGWGQLAPSFSTIKRWAHADESVTAHMDAGKKGDIGETYRDVAEDYAEGMIEARPHLSYSQMPVAFGIAADKPIAWAKVGQAGPSTAIQINVTDSSGQAVSLKKLED